MRHTFLSLSAFLIIWASVAGLNAQSEAVLDSSLTQAAAEKKAVLVEFFSYNSVDSKRLRDTVLSHDKVKAVINDHYVFARVQIEHAAALKTRYGITKVPTLLSLRADGTELDRAVGMVKVDTLLSLLEGAAKGEPELARLEKAVQEKGSDFKARLALADAYVVRKNWEPAVQQYLFCITSEEHEAGQHALHHAALNKLLRLVASEPQAATLPSIRAYRDTLDQNAAKANPAEISALMSLNSALGESGKNIDLYTKLENPLARQRLFSEVFIPLVNARRYQEAVSAVDLESMVNALYAHESRSAGTASTASQAQTAPRQNNHVTAQRAKIGAWTSAAVEALLATNQRRVAQRLAGRLLETFPEQQGQGALLKEAAKRSGAADTDAFVRWLDQEYPERT
jgi:thioredoxin-like negative regulator of GroEL